MTILQEKVIQLTYVLRDICYASDKMRVSRDHSATIKEDMNKDKFLKSSKRNSAGSMSEFMRCHSFIYS